jgi:hypothetical protein
MTERLAANGRNSREEKAEYKPLTFRQSFMITGTVWPSGHLDFELFAP